MTCSQGEFCVHQDWTFVPDPENYTSLTLWCPLVDTSEENGTLQVVEGSHKIVSDIAASTVEFYCKNFESEIRNKYGKPICLKAGECLVFDHSLLHFSDDNYITQPRYVMQAILVPNEVEPVFYYFDANNPEKGFEVFQTTSDFFIFQDFLKRPSNLKSLGFIENQNRFLTEQEFIEKMSRGRQIREKTCFKPDHTQKLENEKQNLSELTENKGNSVKTRILYFFNLLRGNDWWFYKIPPLLAIAYAEILLQSPPPQKALVTSLALLSSMFCVAAYGHVVNDIFDIEVDRRAHKPKRMAALSIPQRLLLCISLAVAGLIPWLLTGFSTQSALLLAGIYALLTVYSAPPLRLKERGFWGVMTDAAAVHAVPTLFVATVLSQITNLPQPESVTLASVATLWAVLVGIRGIVLHQIWDQENDLASGVNTLVVRIGVEPARSWLSFLIFPCKILLLGLLIFVISQFAPLLGGVFTVYVILRGINTHLTSPPVFDPAPAQKASVPAHDFYEAWLPLALLVVLSLREASFISLLAFHLVLFYPAIVKRLVEFNPLLLAGREAMTTLLSSVRHQPVRAIDSWQLAKTEVTTETFSESPSNELEHSIARSVDFLASNQLDDGEFKTEIYQSREMTPGEFIKEWVFDSSPFATSLVLYSLSFLKHESKVKQIAEKGLDFLLSEMEFHGLWRYWSSKNPKHQMIPPDLDDICCVSHILRMHNISHPSNTEILFASRDQQGVFYTWVLPRSFKTIFLNLRTLGKALSVISHSKKQG